ncbi:MAG: xylulokinase [Clostridia bacterium]|nr:xylulokinase [Clostridia bacterium]NLS84826.1 xylulokinase [Oscillospiraceae bacterium]
MMYIGIDLGTSAVKLLLMSADGDIKNVVSKDYPLEFPRAGWSQQAPQDWLSQTWAGIKELLQGFDAREIGGIGVGGQMHGLVVLDENDEVIRPAILWNDGRTGKEVEYLNSVIGKQKLSTLTANIAFAGFTAPKLLWMKANEPQLFARINKIMLPKDYIVYMLTGVHSTDASDASGMLMFDVEHRCWSKEMLEICGVREEQMAKVFESYESVGTVKTDVAAALGFPNGVKVAAGAGDNAAAAVGTGTVGDGNCNISLGTSGTVFISSKKFAVDSHNALHAFAHADGSYHLMGCMLSAASCGKWWIENILQTLDYRAEEAAIENFGENNVFFLPYLMGERSPINDINARGTFIGMSMDSTRAQMTQAVFEGVTFALRDSMEIAKQLGINVTKTRLCGGGAKSRMWRQMVADILNIEVEIPAAEEGPGYGGAMLAAVACGEYSSVEACAEKLIKVTKIISPQPEIAAKYEKQYQKFRKIYPTVKALFPKLEKE